MAQTDNVTELLSTGKRASFPTKVWILDLVGNALLLLLLLVLGL